MNAAAVDIENRDPVKRPSGALYPQRLRKRHLSTPSDRSNSRTTDALGAPKHPSDLPPSPPTNDNSPLHASMQHRRERVQRRWQRQGCETAIAIAINLLWTGAAVGGAIHLVPAQIRQHNRLAEVNERVATLQERVVLLRNKVERGFDPLNTQTTIRERFNYVSPNHIQILLTEPVPAPQNPTQ